MTETYAFRELTAQGFVLRHVYELSERCPMCADRLQRQEWGKTYTDMIGLDVCGCGYTSQQRCIA